jgi:hypothetical protein
MHGSWNLRACWNLLGLLNQSSRCCNQNNQTRNSAVLSVHPPVDEKFNVRNCNCRLHTQKNSAQFMIRMPVALRSVGDGKRRLGILLNGEILIGAGDTRSSGVAPSVPADFVQRRLSPEPGILHRFAPERLSGRPDQGASVFID